MAREVAAALEPRLRAADLPEDQALDGHRRGPAGRLWAGQSALRRRPRGGHAPPSPRRRLHGLRAGSRHAAAQLAGPGAARAAAARGASPGGARAAAAAAPEAPRGGQGPEARRAHPHRAEFPNRPRDPGGAAGPPPLRRRGRIRVAARPGAVVRPAGAAAGARGALRRARRRAHGVGARAVGADGAARGGAAPTHLPTVGPKHHRAPEKPGPDGPGAVAGPVRRSHRRPEPGLGRAP